MLIHLGNEQNHDKQHLSTIHKQLHEKYRTVRKHSLTKQLQNTGHAQGINNHTRDNIWDNIQHILSWMQKCSTIWNNGRVLLTPAHKNYLAEVCLII